MFLLIDNYDSFTYNLFHLFAGLGAEVKVRRNDAVTIGEISAMAPQGIILSPGPGRPEDAGICLGIIERLSECFPVLGICLGHQAVAQAFGGRIIRAAQPMHGKTSRIEHYGTDLFAGLPSPFAATRYHSLVADPECMPGELEVTAKSADGTVMGIRHRSRAVWGLQFHPESIASDEGAALAANFISAAGAGTRADARADNV